MGGGGAAGDSSASREAQQARENSAADEALYQAAAAAAAHHSPVKQQQQRFREALEQASSPLAAAHKAAAAMRTPAMPSQRPDSPPLVSISTYLDRHSSAAASAGGAAAAASAQLDPRLAHLAGVAADPRLGLTPASAGYSYSVAAMAAMMGAAANGGHPPIPTMPSAAHAAAAAAAAAAASPSLPPSSFAPSTPTSMSAEVASSLLQRAVRVSEDEQRSQLQRQFGSPLQYRGEPKATPMDTADTDARPGEGKAMQEGETRTMFPPLVCVEGKWSPIKFK